MSSCFSCASSRFIIAALPSFILLGCGGGSSPTPSTATQNSVTAYASQTLTNSDDASRDRFAATLVYRSRPTLPIPTPIVGVTVDSISRVSDIVTSLRSLARVPTTRIVFDEWVPASDYRNATVKIREASYVMGEILDSYYVPQYTVAQYLARTREYLSTLGDVVDIWEVGNEINGEWLGNNADVVAKMAGAYDIVKAQGKTAELTLYYNKDCWLRPSNEMFTWAQNNVPTRMKQGLDYVLVSYYEDDCNGLQPDWPTVFGKLQEMFPNSKIGFGEVGTKDPAKKAAYINRYYPMNIHQPGYIGGYFWWYFKQDMVPSTKALLDTLNGAIAKMPASYDSTPIIATPAPAPAPAPTPSSTVGVTTVVPTTSTAWTTVYNGYGAVAYDATAGIMMAPQVSTQPSETHAALTLANLPKMRNFRATITAKTEQQLRQNSAANAWEVLWLFFNYNPTTAGKDTNYFMLKPNGVELGTATQNIGQTFLQTGPATASALGVYNKFEIEKIDKRVRVWINGVLSVDYTGSIVDVAGSLGLYTEDARVRITNVQVTPL